MKSYTAAFGPVLRNNSTVALRDLLLQAIFVMQPSDNGVRGDTIAVREAMSMAAGRNFGLRWFRDAQGQATHADGHDCNESFIQKDVLMSERDARSPESLPVRADR